MSEIIGFIGIGNMGGPMANRLLDAGYSLIVFDQRAEALAPLVGRGAHAAASVRDVGEAADIVLVCLPSPAIVEAVVTGPEGLSGAAKVRTIIDLSTTGAQAAKRIGAEVVTAGKIWVDSPVSGGVRGARAGTLAVMVSTARDDFERLKRILSIIGKPFYVGAQCGAAQTMKLVNNLLSGAAMAVSAEAIVLGVKAGLDPDVMIEVINAGSGRNTATQDKFPKAVLPRSFDFGFTNGLMCKDIDLCMAEAAALGIEMPTATAVHQLWSRTLRAMGPERDFTTIVEVVERNAGVEVRGRSAGTP
jgi:3-hydroxyisobutyrate dehydrogenase-like beta-hydroxyacid dehydrogenase